MGEHDEAPRDGESRTPAWDVPVVLGNRLCWFDGERNQTVPVTKIEPVYTDARKDGDVNQYGWHAYLPTENGVVVMVTWDPGDPADPLNSAYVAVSLYVEHPVHGELIGAKVEGDRAVYDPACLGGQCEFCFHDAGMFHEPVTSAVEVMAHLAALGSLRIKAVEPAHFGRERS